MPSRSTFRKPAGEVAYQKQLRDRYVDEGVPPVPHLDLKRSVVRPVSVDVARQVILKYEWLGTMHKTRYHFGLFFGIFCAGVTCTGASVTGGAHNHRYFGLDNSADLLVLARGACVHWAPAGANSKLVSWTAKLLERERAGKLLVAYADSDAGEIGTIYQACNWTYIGPSKEGLREYVAPNGRVYNMKVVYDTRRRNKQLDTVTWSEQRQALLAAGWTEQAANPKHRYVRLLDRSDKQLVDRIESLAQPYPKRDADAASVGLI